MNFTDQLCLTVRGKKKKINGRLLETSSQNLFISGGYIAESDVFQVPERRYIYMLCETHFALAANFIAVLGDSLVCCLFLFVC